MGISNANKELSTARIRCGESFQVKLSLKGEPDIVSHPTDIVLVLDRSRSMEGSPLASLKSGADSFIDIIDEATDSVKDGKIGGGSRIGIVSFSDAATQNIPLITSTADLKTAVNSLTAGGLTNHEAAFTEALKLFDPASPNAKVLVLFTDGFTTVGGDPTPVTVAAKAQGVLIYAIGLSGNGGVDEQTLKKWVSEPSSEFVAITPSEAELEKLFENIARSIVKPGATDIVITDRVLPCFKITAVSQPTKGTAIQTDPLTLQWKIEKLGEEKTETASLIFTVQHVGPCSGTVPVNEFVEYHDAEGHLVVFPSPKIEVDCGITVFPEKCPEPVTIEIEGCKDSLEFDAGRVELESLGRILQLDVTLKNICPHRRVALAVIVNEVDSHGLELKRGLKILTVPAHTRATCQDVTVRCIKFVLPEDLDPSGMSDSICNKRTFKARFIAHYIDHDFACCDLVL